LKIKSIAQRTFEKLITVKILTFVSEITVLRQKYFKHIQKSIAKGANNN